MILLDTNVLSELMRLEPAQTVTDWIAGRPAASLYTTSQTFRIRRQFLEDLAMQPTIGLVGQLNRALLVLHSPVDQVVEVSNANDIFRAARHPRSFVSLDHSDHLLSSDADSRYVGAVIAAWSSRYIGLDQDAA